MLLGWRVASIVKVLQYARKGFLPSDVLSFHEREMKFQEAHRQPFVRTQDDANKLDLNVLDDFPLIEENANRCNVTYCEIFDDFFSNT